MTDEEKMRKNFDVLWKMFDLGNEEDSWFYYTLVVNNNNVPEKLIADKWKEYLQMCKSESREAKFMKNFEKFLKDKGYNQNYNVTLSDNNVNFIQRMQNLLGNTDMTV
jgi:hypothetical protein